MQEQLLWVILFLNAAILLYLLSTRRSEGYHNFASQKYRWSDRTGQNKVLAGELSGFPSDLTMQPYMVYGAHAPFKNLLEEPSGLAADI